MAASEIIVFKPSTPVVAAAVASVPRYDFPVIATEPLHHHALISMLSVLLVNARRLPASHSMIAIVDSVSSFEPQVRSPSESIVPIPAA